MRILINGASGQMGKAIAGLAASGKRGAQIVAGVSLDEGQFAFPCVKDFSAAETDVDCIIDFSNHACTHELVSFAVKNALPLVIGTTGQTAEEMTQIREAAKTIPIFCAANFSIGIALLIELAKKTAAAMPEAEIEIVEMHHDRKLDAPSGTALTIAKALSQTRGGAEIVTGRSGIGKRSPTEIGVQSVRMGGLVGTHEVMIATPYEVITLKHEAYDRTMFAEGALSAAEFILSKPAGLYDMNSLVSF